MNINLTLVMQAVAFAAFIWFSAKFVWPPLMRAIETRQKQIADGLAAGEQGRQEPRQRRDAHRRPARPKRRRRRPRSSRTGEKFRAETIELVEGRGARPRPTASSPPRRPRSSRKSRAREGAAAQPGGRPRGGGRRRRSCSARSTAKAHADLLAASCSAELYAMAELTTIARPYADAAFQIAREENALPGWSEMLRFAECDRRRSADGGRARQPEAGRGRRRNRCCCRSRGDRFERRRPQLRPRAGRGATASRCCRRSRAVRRR